MTHILGGRLHHHESVLPNASWHVSGVRVLVVLFQSTIGFGIHLKRLSQNGYGQTERQADKQTETE